MQSRLRIIGIVAFMAVWILAAGPVLAMTGGDVEENLKDAITAIENKDYDGAMVLLKAALRDEE